MRRRALSLAYLLFLMLGIPTGIGLRSSTQLGAFTGAISYAFLYYVLTLRVGKELALAETLPPVLAAWSTNLMFALAAVVFFYRALWR